MEFWQQLALAALSGSVLTGIVVSLLNNWFESMRDDRRWKREKAERREQWGREKEERERQREWMLQEDIRQQRREWRRERLQPVVKFLDALALVDISHKVYSVADKRLADSDEAKAALEQLEFEEVSRRLRAQVFGDGFRIIASIDDAELRELILDLTLELALMGARLDMGKIDEARARIERLVVDAS